MTARGVAGGAALAVALVAGAMADTSGGDPPLTIAGYRVLAGDFHVHSAIVSAAAVSPWDLVLEARRQRLDAIAITPHNAAFDAAIGRWFARRIGGPVVLRGEEIRGRSYHLIGVGIERRIAWTPDARATIDAVHAQGGVAIAAHPGPLYQRPYDASAMAALDAAEVVHPEAFWRETSRRAFREFSARFTAIGSSDFHGLGRLGMARTYVFVKESTEAAVLDAIRAGRTVVYDADGSAFGDQRLIDAAATDGRLPARERDRYTALHTWGGGVLGWISRVAGIIGMIATARYICDGRGGMPVVRRR